MAVYVEMSDAQFENVNEMRLYPFASGSSLVGPDGVTLPDGFLSDAHFYVSSCQDVATSSGELGGQAEGRALPEVYLSSAHFSPYVVSACFTIRDGSSLRALSVSIAGDNFRPYVPYRLEKLIGSSDVGGFVSFGNIPRGEVVSCRPERARIHPCCVSSSRYWGLRKFIDPRSGDTLSGDVPIVFSGHVAAIRSGNSVTLALDEGSAAELASSCAKASGREVCGATPIRSINDVLPDKSGNIVLWFH